LHRVLLLLAIIWGVVALAKYYKQQSAEKRKSLIWTYAVFGLVLIIIALALTGKLHPIGAVIAATLPFLKSLGSLALRLLPTLARFKRPSFTHPTMTTRYLRVVVDPASGKMSGEVLAGDFHGIALAQLSRDQLQSLLATYQQQDPESAQLLAAYLQQRFQDQSQQQSASGSSNMTPSEALQVLGLSKKANKKDIIAAHRKLMQKIHPDRGGSDYLAAKINQAKECLLNT
jgi:DnaJ domain